MEVKKKIMRFILWADYNIIYIASHHILAYFWVIIISLWAIVITFFSYLLISNISIDFAVFLCGLIWVILYFYFLFHFLDVYLDSIIITDNSMIIYKWYWLFKSTTDIIEFHAIESVYSDQSWVLNFIFNDWDIYIRRSMHTNIFYNVNNPQSTVEKINSTIKQITANTKDENDDEKIEDQENDFNIFIEAMAEIIRDYKKK